jgi:predicted  nucleic acid-binding Zn-ribbon protein
MRKGVLVESVNFVAALVELAHADQQLQKLVSQIQQYEHIKQELITKKNDLNNTLLQASAHKNQLIKNVAVIELDLKVTDEHYKKIDTKLEHTSSAKEYQSLHAEKETLRAKRVKLDEQLLDAWTVRDEYEVSFAQIKKESEEEIIKLDQNLESINAQITTARSQVNHAQELVAKKYTLIPEQLAEEYKRMRASIDNPVVPIIDNACGGCSSYLTTQDLAALHAKRIINCKYCFRFLYTPDHLTSV